MKHSAAKWLLLAGMLFITGCGGYEDLRLYARPADIPEGGASTINMQSLISPFWPPGGAATAVAGVTFTVTGGPPCGTLARGTATSGAGGQANVGFTGATNLTADCTASIAVSAAGTPAAPFSESESVSVTVHPDKDYGLGVPIGTSFNSTLPPTGSYCVYKIATQPPGYTPPAGADPGARPVGTTFCVQCPTSTQSPWGFKFASPTTLTVLNGQIYYYVTKVGTVCTTCPTGGITLSLTNP
ncbi:MAG: hypothetical protein HN834_20580 [Rhodospirillaceae bacterium]|nr:hypothetical protein [Rhodospirillaceae bacterium]